ncbi:MAG: hypothetical protein V3R54_08880 [Thermodesulfovibrionia bacterium]
MLLADAIQDEALVNLHVKKGIITKEELLEEIKKLNKKYSKCVLPVIFTFKSSLLSYDLNHSAPVRIDIRLQLDL